MIQRGIRKAIRQDKRRGGPKGQRIRQRNESRKRFDRCIDFIWVSEPLQVVNSMVCFNQPSSEDPTLWPSDHAGVWADLKFS